MIDVLGLDLFDLVVNGEEGILANTHRLERRNIIPLYQPQNPPRLLQTNTSSGLDITATRFLICSTEYLA